MKKAAIYCRVSTKKQEKHGISLNAQLAKCYQYAKMENLEVVKVAIESESAKNTDRDELQAIIELIAKKKIQHLVTVKLDRLSRDVQDGAGMAKMLGKKGVTLHLTAEGGAIDFNDASQEAMYNMRLTIGQFERKRISLNTRMALSHKREQGERLGGHSPYGFAYENGLKVVNATEQANIERIRELQSTGLSERKLIAALASEGILSRNNTPFTRSSIRSILSMAA